MIPAINKFSKNKIPDFDFSLINELRVEIDFKSNKQTGGLIGYQSGDLNSDEYQSVIYIDDDGNLRGKLWNGFQTLIVEQDVTDYNEYTVIYSTDISKQIQKLELVGFGSNTQTNKILKFNKDNDSNFRTNSWQLGTVFSEVSDGGNKEWFSFAGDILFVEITINGRLHYMFSEKSDDFQKKWDALNNELPNIEISEEEIMNEVRAVRYGS